jgi:hypothetical protein
VSEPSDLAQTEKFFALSFFYRDAFGVYSCESRLGGRYQRERQILSFSRKSGKHEVVCAAIMYQNLSLLCPVLPNFFSLLRSCFRSLDEPLADACEFVHTSDR